uniref:Uncharacterized protein n=1 Tax=Knipowitschia caucasica TaxID=637954 RepID=A0AAV2JUM4_KNICA
MRDFLCLRIWRRESGAESLAQRRADLAPGLDHSLDHSLDGAMRPPALLLLPALLALLPGLELGLSAGPEPSLRASVWDRSPDPEPTDSKPLCRCSWFLVKLRLKDCGPENQVSSDFDSGDENEAVLFGRREEEAEKVDRDAALFKNSTQTGASSGAQGSRAIDRRFAHAPRQSEYMRSPRGSSAGKGALLCARRAV